MTNCGVDVELLQAQADTIFFASGMFKDIGMQHISDLMLGAAEQLYHTWLNLIENRTVTYTLGKRIDESDSVQNIYDAMQSIATAYKEAQKNEQATTY